MKVTTHPNKGKSGISTVVGAALALLVLIAFFTGVYLWTVIVQQSMGQLDWERAQEKIEVDVTFNLLQNGTNIKVKIRNVGAIDVELVSVWLVIKDADHFSIFFSPAKNVPKGTKTEFTVGNLVENINLTDKSSFDYRFNILTDRGNVVTATLTSELLTNTEHPVIVMPGSPELPLSRVSENGIIHLMVWNSLDEKQKIDYMIVTGIDIFGILGPYKRAIALLKDEAGSSLVLPPGQILAFEVKDLLLELNKGERVIIELVNNGQIICTHYFVVADESSPTL